MPSLHDKGMILTKKKILRGSRFFLEEDLIVRQQEERRDEMTKVRAARDERKRAWIYKGKAVIAQFGPPSKTRTSKTSRTSRQRVFLTAKEQRS